MAAARPRGAAADDERHRDAGRDDRRDADHDDHAGRYDAVVRVVGRRGRDASSAYQQTVRVHAIRRAGDERRQIGAVFDGEFVQIVGQDHADAVHPVGEGLVEDMEGEGVAFLQCVQSGQEACARQPRMSGDRRVRGFAADGQRTALQMSDGDLQHGVVGAVVDGKSDAESGNGHVAHDAGAADVQQGLVFPRRLRAGMPAGRVVGQTRVVGTGLFQYGLASRGFEPVDLAHV